MNAVEIRKSQRPKKEINYRDVVMSKIDLEEQSDENVKSSSSNYEESDDNDSGDSDSELFRRKGKNDTKIRKSILDIINESSYGNESNEYKLQREKNMQDRLQVLKTLNCDDNVAELKIKSSHPPSVPKKKKKPVKRTIWTTSDRTASDKLVPVKRSLRLRGKSEVTDYSELTDGTNEYNNSFANNSGSYEYKRNVDENLPIDADIDTELLETLQNDLNIPYESVTDFTTCDVNKFAKIVKSFRMWNSPIKIIKRRICSLSFHSSTKKLLVIAGDAHGHISLWDLTNDKGVEFKGHGYNVNCVSFGVQNNTSYFSTSLDGTVRQGDVNSTSLKLVHSTPEDGLHTTWHHEFGHSLLVAEGTGVVKLIDLRISDKKRTQFKCHQVSVRTVQTNPTNENYFLTSSRVGEFAVHDIRHVNSESKNPVFVYDLKKSLTSAFFSPKGNYILTTGNDDTVRVFDCSNMDNSHEITIVRHDNHGGRWISVFKAIWQPQREDCFYIGSMMTPRRMQLYNRNGVMVREFMSDKMKTICPLISVHPSQPILVGGNSSGRVHIFTPYSNLAEI